MGIKLEPKRHFRHFCFCLGLRLGTSIISALWMTSGVTLTIVFALSVKQGRNMDAYHYKLTVAQVLGALLGVCVGAFGLYGSTNKFTGKSVKLYKMSAWIVQVGIWCLLCLVRMSLSLATRDDYYSWCHAGCTEQDATADAACGDKCRHNVSMGILRMFIEIAFTVAFNVYSTLIVSAYTKQLLQKRETMRLTKRDSLASTVPFHFPPSRNNSLFDREAAAPGLEMKELQTDFFPSPRTSIIKIPPSQPKGAKQLHVPSIYHPNYTAPYSAPFLKSKWQDREAVTPPVDTDKDLQFWTREEEEADENMETITIDDDDDDDRFDDTSFDTYHYKIGTERNKEGIRSPPVVIVSPASPTKEYEVMPDSWGVQEQLSLR